MPYNAKKFNKMLRVACYVLCMSFILPVGVRGDDQNKISLYPATVLLDPVPAGQTTTQILNFKNETNRKQTFQVEFADYHKLDVKNLTFLEFGSTGDTLKGMVKVNPSRFELDAGKEQKVQVAVYPPDTILPGQYKGVVFIGPVYMEADSATLKIAGRVGSLIGVVVTSSLSSPTSSSKDVLLPTILAVSIFIILMALSARSKRKLR